jgi:hypothetical protein
MRRKTRSRLNFTISDVDRYRLRKAIIDASIFRGDRGAHGVGWHDLRGLITGIFFECFDRYCRHDDEESQRALWEEFRDNILAAQKKTCSGHKALGLPIR